MDTAGNAYSVVGGGVDAGGGCCVPAHVVKSAGPDAPTVLPFEYVDGLGGIAVDAAGSVYAGDGGRDRVLKLTAGADAPTALPFNHIAGLVDVAVDSAGSVYAVDANHKRVLKLAPGSEHANDAAVHRSQASRSCGRGQCRQRLCRRRRQRQGARACGGALVAQKIGRDRRPPRSPVTACTKSMAARNKKGMSSRLLEFFLPVSTVGT